MDKDDAYQRARRTVGAKIGFYIHLGIYVAVNILLAVINLKYSPQHWWFLWPLFGWGIGIIFHALGIFVFPSGSAVKERMVEREAERLTSGKE